jgi:tetratricopeptide (TPR) repeat protein
LQVDLETPTKYSKDPYNKAAVEHYNEAIKLHKAGFLSKAIFEYQAAIDEDIRVVEAWTNLGVIYGIQKNYKAATNSFDHALEISPENLVALNGYATCLYEMGRREEALKVLQTALKVSPNFKPTLVNLNQFQKVIEPLKSPSH